jgi:hypothetical protein
MSESLLAELGVRVAACRELASQFEAAAALLDQLELEGWARHIRRDAEILRIRADREEDDATRE